MKKENPIQKPFVPPERTEESKPTSEIPEKDLAGIAGGVSGIKLDTTLGVSGAPLGTDAATPLLERETHEAGLLGTTPIIKR